TTEKIMQYTTDDILKITATSGNYSTVIAYIPTQSKTLTFPFFACTDADGNNYSIVQIGTQFWMGENLKTTKYRNGESIPNITEQVVWGALNSGAYAWYNNDAGTNKNTYGGLYNWLAVSDNRNIAPIGWHIPSDTEWTTLTTYLGGESLAYSKMKETGTSHWQSPNIGATNESGFTALPGGYATDFGPFFTNLGTNSFWWSSTESFSLIFPRALFRLIEQPVWIYLVRSNGSLRAGFSVRCLMDEVPAIPTTPTINTNVTKNVTTISAISGGNIASDGGANVTARGICWNTSSNPTVANSKTDDGTGIGSFTSNITGLTENTIYYLRAYATNSVGTVYGRETSFIAKNFQLGTVTDIDGNIYHTVSIGSQVWMVENLKTTKYNDGCLFHFRSTPPFNRKVYHLVITERG
ncbi:MAG: FISUMP domain-containing protein, partial [Ignavibacteria bacterium]|nr:FISUMP domain-containing protein [Ignavibacteria bacterium]